MAAAQAEPPFRERSLPMFAPPPPPCLSRRKRHCEEEGYCDGTPGGWVETDRGPKYLFRYDPMARRVEDVHSDEGFVEPSGRRVERKDRKNKREQERRKEINDRFIVLSDLLFGSKFSGRVDKTQILDRAIELLKNSPPVIRNDGGIVLAGDSDAVSCDASKRYRECPPQCHATARDHHDMNHLKYHQSHYGPHPSYTSNGHTYPPSFQQYPHHAPFLSDTQAQCFECESDESASPGHAYRPMGSSSGTFRKNGSTLSTAMTSLGSHGGGNCGSRKDFQRTHDDESEDDPSFSPSGDHENSKPSGLKGGFDPLIRSDASIGVEVALLDTLVQLSQDNTRTKK